MIRYSLILIFLCVTIVITVRGQETPSCDYEIKGKVFDYKTKEPLSFVAIQVENTTIGAISDDDGNFLIENLCDKEYDLIFSRLGYKTLKHHHDFHHPEMEIFMVEEHLMLEGVTIEAERTQVNLNTTSSSKLSAEELKAVKSESLGDAVSKIAGVSSLTTGQNISKPIIHGLHSNRILVINNGIRHEFQNWGIEHAPEIDPSLSNQLEVIKGAATVRYGPDALGGVVLVNPPPMELSTPLKGSVELTGKSNGRSGEAAVELSKGFKWFSLQSSGSYLKQGDLTAPDYQLSNTGKEEKSYSAGFRIHPIAELDFEGFYSHFDQNLGILSGSVFGNLEDLQRAIDREPPQFTVPFSYQIEEPNQRATHDLYKATAKYIGQNHAISLQYGYQFNKRKEFGVRRGDAPNIDLELKTHSVDLDWSHPDLGPVSGKMGIQWMEQANDNLPGTNTVPFIPNYDQTRWGAYLIESYDWDNKTLELGVRFDYMDAYIVGREPDNTIYRNNILYRNLSGTLGFKTQLSPQHSFRTNLGTAWRAPNVAELYRFGQHSFFLEYGLWRYTIDERFDFVVTTQGILDENDRPVPAEVGYKWINTYTIDKPGLKAELTGYVNYIENFINSTPGGITRTARGVFVFYINEQTDALFWGADLTVEWEHSQLLSSTFKGSYLWAKQIQRNDFFVEQPPAQIAYDLTYRPSIKWLDDNHFKLSATYTFEQFQHPRIIPTQDFLNALQMDIDRFSGDALDFDLIPPPPAYFLVDLSWAATYKNFDVQLQARNLFNTSYRSYTDRLRYFADGLGRNFVVGVGYRF